MPCSNCNQTLQCAAVRDRPERFVFWCPKCGTLVIRKGDVEESEVPRWASRHQYILSSLETAIRWLRRLEKEYPGCLNDSAIDKHLTPALTEK